MTMMLTSTNYIRSCADEETTFMFLYIYVHYEPFHHLYREPPSVRDMCMTRKTVFFHLSERKNVEEKWKNKQNKLFSGFSFCHYIPFIFYMFLQRDLFL